MVPAVGYGYDRRSQNHGMSTDARHLVEGLVPSLRAACDNRLGDIDWFRADWQRGGAATGTSVMADDRHGEVPVVVKLPIGLRELNWTCRLQNGDGSPGVIPRVYASGDALGGYDFAWLVIERFPFGPLGTTWDDAHIERVADAAARFYDAARNYPIDRVPLREDWHALAKQATESIRVNDVAEKSFWKDGLKRFRKHLDGLLGLWYEHEPSEWIHGDLHLANAMCRSEDADDPVALIDLAEVRAGHWLEDAVYLERQLWSRQERLTATKPVKAIAQARKRYGLDVAAEYPKLAMVRRALLAGSAPAFIRSEGQAEHFSACLRHLNVSLDGLGMK